MCLNIYEGEYHLVYYCLSFECFEFRVLKNFKFCVLKNFEETPNENIENLKFNRLIQILIFLNKIFKNTYQIL